MNKAIDNPPQYSLRALFRVTTICCVLAAAGSFVLLFCIMLGVSLILAVGVLPPALLLAALSWGLVKLASWLMPSAVDEGNAATRA